MPRTWLSIPLGHGVRLGRSIADAELRGHLPSWRKYELCHSLITAAEATGHKMSQAEANYIVEKALAVGLLDTNGALHFTGKGASAEGIAAQIIDLASKWGQPMSPEEALRMATEGIAKARSDRVTRLIYAHPFLFIALAVTVVWAILMMIFVV